MSFWGAPSHKVENPEIIRAMEQFHERVRKVGRDHAMRVAHVTLKASALFLATLSPKEAVACLDDTKRIVETEVV